MEPSFVILADPVRRGLYDFVRRQARPVTREEAAEAQDISRGLAAFHLDKLAEAGLLAARYEAPDDQPRGRGRTPKVYEFTGPGLSVSIPPRNYELIGSILASAVAAAPAETLAIAEAHATGNRCGATFSSLNAALEGLGFEPDTENGCVIMRNCPFHALAATHPALVCALNLAFTQGLIEATNTNATAHLAPRPNACCVEVRRA